MSIETKKFHFLGPFRFLTILRLSNRGQCLPAYFGPQVYLMRLIIIGMIYLSVRWFIGVSVFKYLGDCSNYLFRKFYIKIGVKKVKKKVTQL